jgi:hypothetical protein
MRFISCQASNKDDAKNETNILAVITAPPKKTSTMHSQSSTLAN